MSELAEQLSQALSYTMKGHFDSDDRLLNEAADEQDILALEALIGATLPEDFKSIYRHMNGQAYEQGYLFDGEEWLSLERIAQEWQVWKDLYDDATFEEEGNLAGSSEPTDGAIKPFWWTPAWIPFTYDGSGNHLCLDLDPSDEGTRGQVIRMWHDDAERSLEAESFGAWVTQYVQGINNGEYVYSEDYGGMVSVADLEEDGV